MPALPYIVRTSTAPASVSTLRSWLTLSVACRERHTQRTVWRSVVTSPASGAPGIRLHSDLVSVYDFRAISWGQRFGIDVGFVDGFFSGLAGFTRGISPRIE